jgi:hypothetical protein
MPIEAPSPALMRNSIDLDENGIQYTFTLLQMSRGLYQYYSRNTPKGIIYYCFIILNVSFSNLKKYIPLGFEEKSKSI